MKTINANTNTYIFIRKSFDDNQLNTIAEDKYERVSKTQFAIVNWLLEETPVCYVWNKTLDEHSYCINLNNGICLESDSIHGLSVEAKEYDIIIKDAFKVVGKM